MTGRPGFALVFSLLMLLALASLTAGMLVLGTRDALIHDSHARLLSVRRHAEAALRLEVSRWSTRDYASLTIGGDAVLIEGAPGVEVERVDQELFLLRTVASREGSRAAAAVIIRTVDAERLMEATPAAATVGGDARIVSGRIGPWSGCASGDSVAGLMALSGSVDPAASVEGSPALVWTEEEPPLAHAFSPAGAARLRSMTRAGGAITPYPTTSAGECHIGESSWGGIHPSSPCHDALPYVHIEGNAHVEGGEARAIIVVEGDLVVSDGAELHGMLVVRGELRVESGAIIRGAVRAGSLLLEDTAILFDGCTLAAAYAAPALDRAFRAGPRWWIPAF